MSNLEIELEKLHHELSISDEALKKAMEHFQKTMLAGLAQPVPNDIKMIPSFVTNLPSGKEKGKAYAIDVGGSNIRVLSVHLLGNGSFSTENVSHRITDQLKSTNAIEFCDFIADAVHEFLITKENINSTAVDHPLKFGYTFSFPVHQKSLTKGVLDEWTKGFDVSGFVGEDVVDLLNASFKRKNMKITVTALANDTVGTLMTHAYVKPCTRVGVIFGSGTNAAYVEDVSNIKKWTESERNSISSRKMIINTEWGAYSGEGGSYLKICKYDKLLDELSNNTGMQIYEKMISGIYLEELSRLILVSLIQKKSLFPGKVVRKEFLEKSNSFLCKDLSKATGDDSSDLKEVGNILERELGIHESTIEERKAVQKIGVWLGLRAARLSAIGLAAVLRQGGFEEEGCTVGIDGTMFEKYPNFRDQLHSTLGILLGTQAASKIRLEMAKDGSGVGAAVISFVN